MHGSEPTSAFEEYSALYPGITNVVSLKAVMHCTLSQKMQNFRLLHTLDKHCVQTKQYLELAHMVLNLHSAFEEYSALFSGKTNVFSQKTVMYCILIPSN